MLTLDTKYIVILIFSAVLLPVIFLDHLILLIPVIILLIIAAVNNKGALIVISFVALISLTSGFGEEQRLLVQLTATASLLAVFFKSYGLNFKTYPVVPFRIILLVAAILSAIVFSLLFTEYFKLGMQQLVRSILFFLIAYLYYSLLTDRLSLNYFLIALFAGAVIYFLIIGYEIIIAGFDIIYLNQNLLLEDGVRFIHRNAIGGFFTICISISTAFLVISGSERKKRYYLYLLIILFSTGLLLTNSRAAILSIIISTAYIFYKDNRKALRNLFLSLLCLIPILLIEPVSETVNLYFRLERISTGRDYILETVYSILGSNPLIGSGPAATKFEMYNHLPYMFGTAQEFFLSRLISQIEFGHAHNFYLFLYTDLGILGFIVSLLIPFTFLKLGSSLLKELKNRDNFGYALVTGLQASGIALFLRGIFEWAGIFSYGTLSYDLPFWWIFAIMIFLYQRIIIEKKNILTGSFHIP